MAIFKYTLPSGAEFTLNAPTGTTQAQADFAFYSQVASGALVGYSIGQTLTSAQTRLTNFELSRLERDTAGVDRVTILSIVSNELAVTVPSLANTPLLTPITAANYAKTAALFPLGPVAVGPLTPDEVTGVISTTDVYVDQNPDTITDTGIGTYNLTPATLEKTGYLKPGTSNYPDFACVIGTPSVWTGKDGVNSVAGILDDPSLQAQIQNSLLQNSYDALTAGGTIQTTNTAPASLSTGQIFGAAGLTTLTAASLVSGTAALTGNFNQLVSSSFAGASALGSNVSSLLSNPVNNISTIANGAVNNITQGLANFGPLASTANGIISSSLNSAVTSAGSAISTLTGGVSSAVNSAVTNAVGTVVNNAAQFTAPVAAAWASGSAALNSALGSAQGVLNSALGEAQGLLTSGIGAAKGFATDALGSLSGLATGALGSLGSQAQNLLGSLGGSLDAFGKMSSFSIDFSLFSSDSLVSATKVAAGFSNTVNRQTVDAAVQRLIGNSKIPTPTFEFPSTSTAGINADITYAQNKLKELGGQITTGFTSLTSGISSTGIGTNTVV